MKRHLVVGLVVLALIIPSLALAGGGKTYKCDTKYPVVLAHGAGVSADILGIIDAWWRIDDELDDEGCDVYKTSVNGMDGTAAKALSWKQQFLHIQAVTRAPKLNVIGHSHGTLYTRYAMSNLGLGSRVSSYTSMCGPHRGSYVANLLVYELPSDLLNLAAGAIDFVYALVFGDDNPDTIQMGQDLCTDYMKNVFNPNTPNVGGVYYQSWASKGKWSVPTLSMLPTWLVLLPFEGDNDGLVSVSSAKWGNFRGVQTGAWWTSGVDHMGMVDHMIGITPGFDAPGFYVDVVNDLKNRGH